MYTSYTQEHLPAPCWLAWYRDARLGSEYMWHCHNDPTVWNLQSLTMDELPKNVEMLTDLEYLEMMCKFTLVTGCLKADSTATTGPRRFWSWGWGDDPLFRLLMRCGRAFSPPNPVAEAIWAWNWGIPQFMAIIIGKMGISPWLMYGCPLFHIMSHMFPDNPK